MKNHLRKITLVLFSFSLSLPVSKADEGMWLPLLLKQIEGDMQARGLKLTAEQIYSINNSSLKDAVVHFGGGCTGEIISASGLLLTNHHCGYRQIQSHSSVDNNYLDDGFWAMSQAEELPNPGLTATFIIRMEDVTAKVFANVDVNTMTATQADSVMQVNIKKITASAVEGTHYEAFIRPFYYGNEYYMFVTETFRDVRLVGAPPSSIGKFGGDTDNWMWPRHTGDFSLFRVYAGPDNKPADYSTDNVPFKPRYHFPISLKGVSEGDFTMVYGFPGRTQEYIPSPAVELVTQTANPARIKIREARLEQIWEDMIRDEAIQIKYAAKYASVSNYYKKWIGENRGLSKADAIKVKQERERIFRERVNANPTWQAQYGSLLPAFESLYDSLIPVQRAYDYFVEAILGIELLNFARGYEQLVQLSKTDTVGDEQLSALAEKLLKGAEGFYKDYHAPTDRKVFETLLALYLEDMDRDYMAPNLLNTVKKYKGDLNKMADDFYEKSVFADQGKLKELLTSYSRKDVKQIEKDPAYQLIVPMINHLRTAVLPDYARLNQQSVEMMNIYMRALREVMPEKKYYPDANSTLRVAFGQVDGYEPQDGMVYHYQTTLEGVMEKYEPGDEEFDVPEKLIQLYRTKDYGPYGQDSTMPVCFIASNHTTGGNSGSPVIDAEGNLIGTNFDRNWQGTMSDIMYDPNQVRNIIVDIRYTLFIVDKFAGATHLIEEMSLVR